VPPTGRCWSSGKGASLYEGHIYFELNMSTRQNIYFGTHFEIFCLSLSTSTG
jgi:hypothetical protein